MNVIVQIPGMPAMDFGPTEARKAAAYLGGSIQHVNEFEQAGYLRAIRELEQAADTDGQFDMDRYTPDWYVPGWAQEP